MEANAKMPLKQFYLIVASCAVIIFCECLQVLMRVRDPVVYDLWTEQGEMGTSFDFYIAMQLGYFFTRIIIPMGFSLYSYFTYIKMRIGYLFVFMWSVLMIGALASVVVEWEVLSVIYYIKIIGYFLCIGTIFSLNKVIKAQNVI